MTKYNEQVWVTLQVEGTHYWPSCPFEEVAFLRNEHRHIFHVKAYKIVTHSDRDVEFIMLKRAISRYLYVTYANNPGFERTDDYSLNTAMVHKFGAMSCEMIAKDLIKTFELSRCEVSEDLENGCIVEPVCSPAVEIDPLATSEIECPVCGEQNKQGCNVC